MPPCPTPKLKDRILSASANVYSVHAHLNSMTEGLLHPWSEGRHQEGDVTRRVAIIGNEKFVQNVLMENLKGRIQSEDLGVSRRKMLKFIIKSGRRVRIEFIFL